LGTEHAFNAQTAPNPMQSADMSAAERRIDGADLQGFPSDLAKGLAA
jgi:hypothetical protein